MLKITWGSRSSAGHSKRFFYSSHIFQCKQYEFSALVILISTETIKNERMELGKTTEANYLTEWPLRLSLL